MNTPRKASLKGYPQADLEDMGEGLRYTQWILSEFLPWLEGDVCEVGAGTGNISRSLPDLGSHLVCLEPDSALFEALRANLENLPNCSVLNSTLAEYSAPDVELFDRFLYINVLEHIEDDVEELRLMHSLLRPEGAVLIFVPALQWLFSDYDARVGHYRRYSKKELTGKIERAGFEIKKIRYFDVIGVFAWWLACKVLRLRPNAGNVGLYDRFLVPVSRWVEKYIPFPVGKNLLVVAVKR